MTPEELGAQITQNSKVLAEQFYFFTVVIMWLIHAGFMATRPASRAARTSCRRRSRTS